MLALDWVGILQEMLLEFDAETVTREVLYSQLVPNDDKLKLRKSLGLPEDLSHRLENDGSAMRRMNELISRAKTRVGFVLLDYPGYGLNQVGG